MSDKKIIVGGRTTDSMSGNAYATLARCKADGTLDASFGAAGKVTNPFGGTDDEITCLGIDSQGRILAGGSTFAATRIDVVARFTRDGVLDTTFNGTGISQGNFGVNAEVRAIAVQSDDKVIVGTDDDSIARFNTDGSIDWSRNPAVNWDGLALFAQVNALAIDQSGKIVFGGIYHRARDRTALGRLNADGTADGGFGTTGGGTTIDSFSADRGSSIDGLAVAAGGNIIASGYQWTFADGFRDALAAFDSGGAFSWLTVGSYTGVNDEAYSVTIQGDGKIVTSGVSTGGIAAVARFSSAGVLDAGFGTAGVCAALFGGGADQAWQVVIQPSGLVVVAGEKNLADALGILTSAGASSVQTTGTFAGAADKFFAVALQDAAETCVRVYTSHWITKICFLPGYGVRVTFKDGHGKLFTALYPGTTLSDYDSLVASASKGRWIHAFYYKKRPYVVWPVSP